MDQKLLDIEGIVSGSSSINQESSNLTEVCASLYSLVTSLRENEDFKTMVASSEYFGSIDILNQQVPRYAEALLQFSKFLSNYVLENYSDTDAEMKAKVEANLAEAIAKLGETDETVGTGVDYSKISTTAAGALSGDFIDSSKIQKSTFEDGELEFITRPDGSVQIVKDGTVLGYTTQDGIGNAQSTMGANTGDGTEEVHTSMSKEEIAGTAMAAATSAGIAASGTTSVGETTVTEEVPETSAPTLSTGQVPSGLSSGYFGEVHTKGQASANIKESSGNITTGNQSYTIVPDSEYTKAPGTISESDYHLLIAQVAGEAGASVEPKNYKDDMLGVTTTVLNRLETEGKYGDSVREVLEGGYFPFGETYRAYEPGGKYYNTDWGQDKLRQATEVVNDALGGARNLESNVYYYSGNGEYNRFSDVL